MPRFALCLAYDGGDFAGWWRQPGRRTVAGVLDEACRRCNEPQAQAEGAARTDAGVHARGQVAQLDCQRAWQPNDLLRALNHQLPSDCACTAVAAVANDWGAPAMALAKTYRYRFDIGPIANPFLARTSWRAPDSPPIERLRECSPLVLGSIDASAFARRGDHRQDHRCTISAMDWHEQGPERWVDITADRFTYRLVRSLVAAVWYVARGRASSAELQAAIGGTVNDCSRQQAPARGLCLERVTYDPDPFAATDRQRSSWSSSSTGYVGPA